MSTKQLSDIVSPLASPLPPPPEGDAFTAAQWTTFFAITDAVVASISGSASESSLTEQPVSAERVSAAGEELQLVNGAGADVVQAYLAESASSIPDFRDRAKRAFAQYVRPEAAKGVGFILSAVNSTLGCLLLTQSTTPLHLQPVAVRQQILHNWYGSYLPPLRLAAKAFSQLTQRIWLQTTPTLGPIIGLPRGPAHVKRNDGFPFSFLQFPPDHTPAELETDVVIIGSGCGGGVCGANLAKAGFRVTVVERAYHFPPTHFPMQEKEAGIHLFQNGGIEVSDDNSISTIAGSCWGGGGTVNWSASLQPPAMVRQEWADSGLSFFTSAEFQTSLDRVCDRMGVSSEHIEHSHGNRVLMEGARKLGYAHKAVPQNTGGHTHNDGFCTLGCAAAEKQGPVASWLPDAAEAGAEFIEGMMVEKIIFETKGGKKTAVGVEGTWTSRDKNGWVSRKDCTTRKVIIKAKRVIVAAGTLQSPLLLQRSGLKSSQIGRNLHLHPVSHVVATYGEDTCPWEGPILTSVVTEFDNEDGQGHGTRIETNVMLPHLMLTALPWPGGLEWKKLCADFRKMAGFVIIARDRDTGRIFPDPVDGRCRIEYTPSAFDKQRIVTGVLAAAKILYVSGAKEIRVTTRGVPTFFRHDNSSTSRSEDDNGINDPAFKAWLDAVRAKGLPAPDATIASAHQMGTCRMGSNAKNSVVDPTGKVWGTEGLYVADASIFPSASGVNPMITNMGISDWISRGIGRDLSRETGKTALK